MAVINLQLGTQSHAIAIYLFFNFLSLSNVYDSLYTGAFQPPVTLAKRARCTPSTKSKNRNFEDLYAI